MPRPEKTRRDNARRRIERIRSRIEGFDLVCSGTLIERTKTCGKPNCRCATDPQARHGPYYEWSWRQEGRLVHKIVTPEQARRLKEAMNNAREVQALLRQWERESRAILLRGEERK